MMRSVNATHREALGKYAATPIDAPITVFRSRKGHWDDRVGWDLFARAGYACEEFEGDRESMFEPPRVQVLSKALSAAMKRALREFK